MTPARIGVLISGRGTNLQSIIDAVASGAARRRRSRWSISNRPDAAGLQRARDAGIEALVPQPARLRRTGEPTTRRSPRPLAARDVTLVCLAGLHAPGRRTAARRVSAAHPQHPPVAAAVASRARRAAPGARARRSRHRRDGASRHVGAGRRANRPAGARCRCGRRYGRDAVGANPRRGASSLSARRSGSCSRAAGRSQGRRFVRRRRLP